MSKLYRSRRDKKVTGLCGGLAETLNVDATLLRLLVVLTTIFSGGTVIFIYFVAAIVIPKEPGFDPPYDPYGAAAYGNGPYGNPGWNAPQRPQAGPQPGAYANSFHNHSSQSGNIDDMMKDIEKKALQKELEELRAKVAQFEKTNDNNKGEV